MNTVLWRTPRGARPLICARAEGVLDGPQRGRTHHPVERFAPAPESHQLSRKLVDAACLHRLPGMFILARLMSRSPIELLGPTEEVVGDLVAWCLLLLGVVFGLGMLGVVELLTRLSSH